MSASAGATATGADFVATAPPGLPAAVHGHGASLVEASDGAGGRDEAVRLQEVSPAAWFSRAHYLTIVNRTPYAIRLAVSGVNSSDWDGYGRPDNNLQGVVLQPGEAVKRREEVNVFAAPKFNLTLENAATGAVIGTSSVVKMAQVPAAGFIPVSRGGFTLWPRIQEYSGGGLSVTFSSMRESNLFEIDPRP